MHLFAIFAIGSMAVLGLSWNSLRDRRSHGFYRFFAFACLLALIVLNLNGWFASPFSTRQIASWVLLTASLPLAVHGFHLLRRLGEPRQGIEQTTRLVRRGAYRYIRHPLYASLLLLSWGVFLKGITLLTGVLVLVISAVLVATAKAEEKKNVQAFGNEYLAYAETTKMFIPFVF